LTKIELTKNYNAYMRIYMRERRSSNTHCVICGKELPEEARIYYKVCSVECHEILKERTEMAKRERRKKQ